MGRGCTNDQTGDQEGGLSTEVQIYLCWNGKGCTFFFTGAELTLSGSILERWYDVSERKNEPRVGRGREKKTSW